MTFEKGEKITHKNETPVIHLAFVVMDFASFGI